MTNYDKAVFEMYVYTVPGIITLFLLRVEPLMIWKAKEEKEYN